VPCSSSSESLLRWKQHYEVSLNFPPATSCDALTYTAREAVPDSDVNMTPPRLQEVAQAVAKFSMKRQQVPLEILKW